jgi:hypothetical protein
MLYLTGADALDAARSRTKVTGLKEPPPEGLATENSQNSKARGLAGGASAAVFVWWRRKRRKKERVPTMRIRRMLSGVTAMLGLTVVGLVATPSSAQASLTDCSATARICVWTDADYASNYQAYATQVNKFPPVRNNSISSIWNRHSQGWTFYDGPDFTVPMFCLMPGARVRNLGDWHNPELNDRISSARRTGFTGCPAGIPTIF